MAQRLNGEVNVMYIVNANVHSVRPMLQFVLFVRMDMLSSELFAQFSSAEKKLITNT